MWQIVFFPSISAMPLPQNNLPLFFSSLSAPQFFYRNDTSTTISQQIISSTLLMIVIIEAKK